MIDIILPFIIAFVTALIPILIWLYFLEQEDKHPEPKRLILYAFLAGFIAVAVAIAFEKAVADVFSDTIVIIILWAAIEELVKYILVYIIVLRRIDNDEPIDSLMYIIATALGFSSLENALFILDPIMQGNFTEAFIIGNFRFIGATLLHTVSSSIIGLAIAFAFYKSRASQRLYLVVGIILAILLHTFFNLSIIISNGSKTLIAFFAVWVGLVFIFLLIEKVKKIKSNNAT
ncbi:MAG: PrsW family intramembrane metalloprotease [bacterium]|nr:PrsW family intramembrane metalloprotease [bacterium]